RFPWLSKAKGSAGLPRSWIVYRSFDIEAVWSADASVIESGIVKISIAPFASAQHKKTVAANTYLSVLKSIGLNFNKDTQTLRGLRPCQNNFFVPSPLKKNRCGSLRLLLFFWRRSLFLHRTRWPCNSL